MKVVTADEMRRIDRAAIDGAGIPSEVLMGFAGKAVADIIFEEMRDAGQVVVCSGTGNNGGDGFVIAYLLANRGMRARVILAGSRSKMTPTAAVFLNICERSGVTVEEVRDENELRPALFADAGLVVDALAGTGFTGAPRGLLAAAIAAINACGARVLSVDMPSGLPSDGEGPAGEAVRADMTVTIGLPKVSLVTWPGRPFAGELRIADIGFPAALAEGGDIRTELADTRYARRIFPPPPGADFHKGAAGHLLLAGGFDTMEGAIIMTAEAAFQTGVGLATLITTPGARVAIAGAVPELITRSLEGGEGTAIAQGLERLMGEDRRYGALVIGPGMGRGAYSRIVFDTLIGTCAAGGIPSVLIDGDGLYHLAEYLKENRLPGGVRFIITPHFLEASRILGMSVEEIKNNRFGAAGALAERTGCTALLKGPGTVIHDGADARINTTGNPALATAGSGDVLSGIIGALLLRDMPPLDAAALGAHIHGLAADLCSAEQGLEVMKATDGVRFIRMAMASLAR
ncbi:MAG: NAD(P)H-hydrate dehydratase [Spirochaetes bacterium]|nr:MAG: NAD(P)H-hydrate dehydratase [Spirochaetota bacterium]